MMRSGNPALRPDVFTNMAAVRNENAMTIEGTTNKTFILLCILMVTAYWGWTSPQIMLPFLFPAAIAGFITALITIFKKDWAAITAPIYAALEGIVLSGVSLMYEKMYPGMVMQAVGLTFFVLFSLLAAYKSHLIKATENFKLGVFAATGGIAIFYLISMIAGFFGKHFPIIYGNSPLAIGFSAFVVIVAALNLVMDFDFIEKGAESNAPKYMEWYGAFGLIVTLVWLYLEILRLLSKLRSRR